MNAEQKYIHNKKIGKHEKQRRQNIHLQLKRIK